MKSVRSCIIVLILCIIVGNLSWPLSAQEPGKLFFQITPGVNIPLGPSRDMYTIGGGGELTMAYTMPFAPFLFAKGAIDYSLVPTLSDNSLSLIFFGGGLGVSFDPLPWLNLQASGSVGYGLGIYTGQPGGSLYLEGSGLVSFFFTPAFSLGVGGGYRHQFSQPVPFYQAVRINIGTTIRLGTGAAKSNMRIPKVRFDPVFPVFYKHYDDHTVGDLTLVNEEKGPVKNVTVSLFINQYMDGPKECAVIPEMKKGEIAEIPLYALFTDNVLSITEGTKVTAQLLVSYEYSKRDMSFETTETGRMYDRNAMTWDDDRKAAAFITAKDPEVLKFAKNIAGLVRENSNKAVNLNFRIGMGLFEALGEHGVNYVVDPQTPYAEFSKDSMAVDYLQFPVQTLDYKAGDCDDLSICYSTMLESTGIETAFITTPGHIFMAFSLGINPDDAKKLFKNPGNLIYRDNTTWLPVETTMVQDGFLKAWEMGAKEWRENNLNGNAKIFPIHEAWQSYEPVGLPDARISLTAPASDDILERYTKAVNRFVEREIADKVAELEERIKTSRDRARLQNKLGVLYAQYGLMEKAKEQFVEAAQAQSTPAYVNLGNILFLEKQYEEALEYYELAEAEDPENTKVLLGIAKANYELENQGTVKKAYAKIQQKDPDLAERFSYLVSATDDSARASSATISETVVWDEEE
ncbi:MAG: tetratricopeptide repeat protein [Spirochaetales bacterium]|nr:MAG: tetratricopeptide repeat protein [Spirochaetales bacterium]